MRAVACEEHAAVAERGHAQAGEGVDARPHKFEFRVAAQQRAHARQHLLGLLLHLRIGVPAELEVDAPDIVGLAMQQHRLAGMERRIEPEPALRRKVRLHAHVGDQKTVAKRLTLALVAQRLANEAARSIRGDEIIADERVDSVRSLDLKQDLLAVLVDADHLALPAKFEVRQRAGALEEIAFDVILLEIDERGATVSLLRQKVEAVDFVLAKENPAPAPADALGDHWLPAAKTVEDLQCAFGEADGAGACGEAVVVVEKQDVGSALREVNRRGETDRARSDDHDRPAPALGAAQFRRAGIGEGQGLIVDLGVRGHVLSSLGAPTVESRAFLAACRACGKLILIRTN